MKKLLTLLLLLAVTLANAANPVPRIIMADKLRIREAMLISDKYSESIWKGMGRIPFAMILVTDTVEFLINHNNPSAEFKLLGMDPVLKTNVYYRKRQFDKNLLATFPAVNGVSCVVAGTAKNTGKNSTEWIVSLLHEHFHQYENAAPDYFISVENLGLSNGDQTGMWMLNYNFPYDTSRIQTQYQKYAVSLSEALQNLQTNNFKPAFASYVAERKALMQLLKPEDYKYFSFQVWQEGIARYTEYKFLEAMAQTNYKPTKEVTQLPDFIDFKKYKDDFYKAQVNSLSNMSLNKDKRVCFYSAGFAEGLLLDKVNTEWHNDFLTKKFFIEKYSPKYN